MKNYIYVVLSNSISLVIGIITFVILPQTLTITEYGYWQMFYLYASFLGLFTFGITDGFHLKHSGSTQKSVDKPGVKSTFILIIGVNIFWGIVIFLSSLSLNPLTYETNIVKFLSLTLIFFNIYGFFLHLFQVTSQFKQYSLLLFLDKVLFLSGIVILWFFNYLSVTNVIILFLIIKIILSLRGFFLSTLYFAKEVRVKKENIIDSFSSIKSGIILMVLMLTSNLLINYPRVIFSYKENIENFAFLSFSFSLVLVVIQIFSSVSVIFFQSISKASNDEAYKNFDLVSKIISGLFPLLVTIYLLTILLIPIIFPKYVTMLDYFYLIFPIILIQLRYNLLILNWYKKEGALKEILFNSCVHLFLGFIFISFTSQSVKFSLLIYIVLHLIYSMLLSNKLKLKINSRLYYPWKEFVSILLFVIINFYISEKLNIIFNLALIFLYIYINTNLYKSIYLFRSKSKG